MKPSPRAPGSVKSKSGLCNRTPHSLPGGLAYPGEKDTHIVQLLKQDIMTTEMDRRNILYTRELRGYERGLGQGREEGRVEGREEERLKNAANLKRLGVPIETIAKGTGLSEEQVRAL